jgi:hypothetical protein
MKRKKKKGRKRTKSCDLKLVTRKCEATLLISEEGFPRED